MLKKLFMGFAVIFMIFALSGCGASKIKFDNADFIEPRENSFWSLVAISLGKDSDTGEAILISTYEEFKNFTDEAASKGYEYFYESEENAGIVKDAEYDKSYEEGYKKPLETFSQNYSEEYFKSNSLLIVWYRSGLGYERSLKLSSDNGMLKANIKNKIDNDTPVLDMSSIITLIADVEKAGTEEIEQVEVKITK